MQFGETICNGLSRTVYVSPEDPEACQNDWVIDKFSSRKKRIVSFLKRKI